jgi:hypothetical protein
MKLKGRYISLMMERGGEYVTVGLSTACMLAVMASPVEVAAQSTAAKEFRGGRYEYNITVDKLYEGSVRKGDTLEWAMSIHDRTITGKATVASQGDNAPANGYASTSIALTGIGELRWADAESWDLRDAYLTVADIIDLADALSEADELIDFNV